MSKLRCKKAVRRTRRKTIHTLAWVKFRAGFLGTKGGTHTEDGGFGKDLAELFPSKTSRSAFALFLLSRKSALKPVRGVYFVVPGTVVYGLDLLVLMPHALQ